MYHCGEGRPSEGKSIGADNSWRRVRVGLEAKGDLTAWALFLRGAGVVSNVAEGLPTMVGEGSDELFLSLRRARVGWRRYWKRNSSEHKHGCTIVPKAFPHISID